MPWVKGQSGNPKGMAPQKPYLTPAIRAVLRNRPEPGGQTNRELVAQKLLEVALAGDVQAIKVLLDRVDGKVPDNLQLSGADGGALAIRYVNDWRRPEAEQ